MPPQNEPVLPQYVTVPPWHGSVLPQQTAFECNRDDVDENQTKDTNDGYLQAGT